MAADFLDRYTDEAIVAAEDEWASFYTCRRCYAVVRGLRTEEHDAWHAGLAQQVATDNIRPVS